MIPAVIFASVLLAQAGLSVQEEQDCSKVEECYDKLRKHMQSEIEALPGPDSTQEHLAAYKRFCEILFQPDSPCSRNDAFKECSKRPGIEAREKVYEQFRGFICADNETSWKRFMGIKFAKTLDPCKGALETTRDVLKGQLEKCGTVKQLFGECAVQQRFPIEQLETGMDLLGCQQQQPPTTKAPQPGPAFPDMQRCNKDEALECLKEEAMDLATSFAFKEGDPMKEQSACTRRDQNCLQEHPLYGCSIVEGQPLDLIQAGIDSVRQEACKGDRELLKKIRRVASCYDLAAFERCLNTNNVHIEAPMLSPGECRSILARTNDCIDKSRKTCAQDADAWIVKKIPSAFLSVYGCQAEEVGADVSSPTSEVPPAKPPKFDPKNTAVSLTSSLTLALSLAPLSAFVSQH